MKRLFIVDYENQASLNFIDKFNLNTCDRVVLFYSKSQDKISIDRLMELKESGCHLEFVRAEVGIPNALDFQLVVFATEQMRRYRENYVYYIVTEDKGIELGINYYVKLVDAHINIKFIDKNYDSCKKTMPSLREILKEEGIDTLPSNKNKIKSESNDLIKPLTKKVTLKRSVKRLSGRQLEFYLKKVKMPS